MLPALHSLANLASPRHFHFSASPTMAPYCARGGVKMVSPSVNTLAVIRPPISHPFGTGVRAILLVPTSTILASRSLPRTFRGRPLLKGDDVVAIGCLAPPEQLWLQNVKHHLQVHRPQ